jgi:TatD DNase family protein
MTYIDIGINLTNKQFQNDIDDVVQDALDADVAQMILTFWREHPARAFEA